MVSDEPQIDEIDFKYADRIHNTGGSTLQMSRYKPQDSEFSTSFFIDNNIKLLVSIGGDDTATTSDRLFHFLTANDVKIQTIHVPKTIDNDLPLPEGVPTFGYQSAKEEGVKIATTIYEDARTSGNWFVICAMGREAGHLALGVGSAVRFPMIIIPEMFNNTTITIEKIIRLMISSIIKKKILGIHYGGIIISEGVFHFLTNEEIVNTGIHFTYDSHGHPELGTVSKAHIFNLLLAQELKRLNLDIKSRPVELGYELRCIQPVAYDLVYCTLLGIGTKRLFDSGYTACMVCVDHIGNISPLFLKDVEDEHGKIIPRMVNINSERSSMIFDDGLQYLNPGDYADAKKYISNPEYYDFRNILEW